MSHAGKRRAVGLLAGQGELGHGALLIVQLIGARRAVRLKPTPAKKKKKRRRKKKEKRRSKKKQEEERRRKKKISERANDGTPELDKTVVADAADADTRHTSVQRPWMQGCRELSGLSRG